MLCAQLNGLERCNSLIPLFSLSSLLHSEQLEINQAAQKAVGELDTVLEWLEGLGQKTHT